LPKVTKKMSKKDEFLKVLNDSRTSLSPVDKLAKQLTRDVQFVQDVGECAEGFVNGLPNEDALDPQSWNHLIATWQGIRKNSESIASMGTAVDSFTAAVSGSGLTLTTVFKVVTVAPTYDPTALGKPIENFYRLLDKDDLGAEVRALIARFGLDARAGSNRSPLELFEDATAALERPIAPDSPSGTTLILRECIDQIIDRLLKRRPKQEPTGGRPAKINSLGAQCGKAGLPSDHFVRLGSDTESLQNYFSGTKPLAIPREQLIKRFEDGALLIKSILTSIDEHKLRA